MRKLAKTIEVVQARNASQSSLLIIDGEEFPWHISTDGITTTVRDDEPPSVTITIPTEHLSINNTL